MAYDNFLLYDKLFKPSPLLLHQREKSCGSRATSGLVNDAECSCLVNYSLKGFIYSELSNSFLPLHGPLPHTKEHNDGPELNKMSIIYLCCGIGVPTPPPRAFMMSSYLYFLAHSF